MTSNRLGDVLRQGIVAGELDKLLMEGKKALATLVTHDPKRT